MRCRRVEPETLGVGWKERENEITSGCRSDGEDEIAVAEWRMWGPNKVCVNKKKSNADIGKAAKLLSLMEVKVRGSIPGQQLA